MIAGRIIGWILFIAALPVLATDVLLWMESGYWLPIALEQLWYDLSRSSLSLVQAVVSDWYPFFWDPLLTNALGVWAFLALMGLGTFIMTFFRERTNAGRF